MSRALFEHGWQSLDRIVRPGMLCAFDFDGTLSPIVDQPDRAGLAPEVVKRLASLSALAPVAIVTGRSLADIGPRLGFTPKFLVGNHGIEGVPGQADRAQHYRALCARWKAVLVRALQDPQQDPPLDPQIWIEDKEYSLSVHFRAAADPVRTESALAALFARLDPAPRVVAGKCVFNLVAPGAADKGAALLQLMRVSGAPSAIYVGDDVTDEDVFVLRRPDLLSVRIEPAPASAAEFYLHRQDEIVRLLDELIGRLGAHPPVMEGTS